MKNMPVATSTISSMNYFFLKSITGKLNNEAIDEELSIFLTALADNSETISEDAQRAIKSEIKDGQYFEGMATKDIRDMIDKGVLKIVGNPLPNITQFYTDKIIETYASIYTT